MNKVLKQFGLILLIICLCLPAYSQYSEPGPVLNMLRQIQGSWRSDCVAVAKSRYQETKVKVSFTHFAFTTVEFSEPDCIVPRSTYKTRYRFVLREPLVTEANTEAFAIDFSPEEIAREVPNLHPLNIIQYKNGTLRLGSPPVLDTQERLQKLDRELIFSR